MEIGIRLKFNDGNGNKSELTLCGNCSKWECKIQSSSSLHVLRLGQHKKFFSGIMI